MEGFITQYELPRNVLPRYAYTVKLVYHLNKKCQRLIRKSGLSDPTIISKFGKVFLNLESGTSEEVLKEDEIVRKPSSGPLQRRQITIREYIEERKKLPVEPANPEVFVTSCESAKNTLPEHFGSLIVLISLQSQINEVNRFSRGIVRSSRANFARELNNILEHHVFKSVKARVEVLQWFLTAGNLESDRNIDSSVGVRSVRQEGEYARTLLRKYELIQEPEADDLVSVHSRSPLRRQYSVDRLCEHMNENIDKDLANSLASMQLTSSSPTGSSEASIVKLRKHLDIVRNEDFQQEIKDLLAEITAHYMRSNIPETQWPRHSELPGSLKEEIPGKIFAEIKDAISCCYRLDTLQVVVDGNTRLTKYEIEEKVCRILRGENVNDNFVLRYSPPNFQDLYHCSVGSTVHIASASPNEIIGTVGGFARRNGVLHGLTARHVAEMSAENVNIRSDTTNDIVLLGRHLTPCANFPRMPCDIAAIRVNDSMTNVCSVRLKDESGEEMNSQLYDPDSGRICTLVALPVHIWGARSKPGKGKIMTPEQFMKSPSSCRLKYIIVEDCSDDDDDSDTDSDNGAIGIDGCEMPRNLFAQKGDSGSIVCYVDPDRENLFAISMLSGSQVDKDQPGTEGNERKSYFTFSLRQGFTQLRLEQGDNGAFELC